MKSHSHFIVVLLLSSFLGQELNAQVNNSTDKDVNTVQLSVMIVPFVTKGEDRRKLYDGSKAVQVAIDKLKEAFDKRGYQVVDFVTAYDNAMSNEAIQRITNQDDALNAIARNSNTDVMITLDVLPTMHTDLGTSVTVRLNAMDGSTNYAYGTKECVSPYFNTRDSLALLRRAMTETTTPAVEEFLNKLQNSFTSLLQKGRPLYISLGVGKNSMWSFSSKLPSGETLSVAINNWMKTAAYKNYSQMRSVSNISMEYSDVRIPIKDNMGLNYSPFDFATKISDFLVSKGLKVGQPFMQEGKLFVTIN
ncbi:MAG TPA: DUF6175 family protein [Puia sp.]|nr:DUF6175 family protein [Puia sp.]